MVKISIFRKKNVVNEINVEGHAGFNDHGEDIVCAAVSVLTISILNGLTEVVGRQDLKEIVDEGLVKLKLPEIQDSDLQLKTDILIETYILGIKGIKEAYGEYIQLEES